MRNILALCILLLVCSCRKDDSDYSIYRLVVDCEFCEVNYPTTAGHNRSETVRGTFTKEVRLSNRATITITVVSLNNVPELVYLRVYKDNVLSESLQGNRSVTATYIPTSKANPKEKNTNKGCGMYNGRSLTIGPKGGCYYINSNGNKTYVDRSYCKC